MGPASGHRKPSVLFFNKPCLGVEGKGADSVEGSERINAVMGLLTNAKKKGRPHGQPFSFTKSIVPALFVAVRSEGIQNVEQVCDSNLTISIGVTIACD